MVLLRHAWVLLTIVVLGLGIACLIVSQQAGGCDNKDSATKLKISDWLLGEGVLLVVLGGLMFIAVFWTRSGQGDYLVRFIVLCCALFALAWFIVGAIILFNGNIDCIKNSSGIAIFALVVWCLMAVSWLLGLSGDVQAIASGADIPL